MKERKFEITQSSQLLNASITLVKSENDIDTYRVNFQFREKCVPEAITISWKEVMKDMLSWWQNKFRRSPLMHQWYRANTNESRFCSGAPVMAAIGNANKNTFTVAVSDPETPIAMTCFVDDFEQKEEMGFTVQFFAGQAPAMCEYTADIRIDYRKIPFYESVMSVSGWWAEYGYAVPPCSVADEEPLYSTWYNYHQSPKDTDLLADLKIAAEAGFKTLIIDDGWQIDGVPSGDYRYCGVWEVAPRCFTDLKDFVRQTHELGIKVMMWFTVPFIGVESPLHDQFLGKYLYHDDTGTMAILDPRFPEVREFLVEIYAHYLREYDLDGFKLDFVDWFKLGDEASTEYDKMDIPVLEDAMKQLLTEIYDTLNAIKPNMMFEFRQGYIGPAILKYGTMLRVGDCAYDALSNRIGIADLRLLNYPIAIHSDMLYWGKEEPLELCAKQLLNILFAVPQISIKVSESPAEQNELLKYYVNYWTENRDVLLHGAFKAEHPELYYTKLSGESDQLRIVALYAGNDYCYDGKDCDVFNAGDEEYLLVENAADNTISVQIRNCMGEILGTESISANTIRRLPVPISGMAQIRKA